MAFSFTIKKFLLCCNVAFFSGRFILFVGVKKKSCLYCFCQICTNQTHKTIQFGNTLAQSRDLCVALLKKTTIFTVFAEYMKLSGFQLEESIKRETSGHLKEVLLAVGKTQIITGNQRVSI